MRLVPWIPPLFRDRAAAGRALSEVAAVELDEPVVIGVARPPYLREGHGVTEAAVEEIAVVGQAYDIFDPLD